MTKNYTYKLFVSIVILSILLLSNYFIFNKISIKSAKNVLEKIVHQKEDKANELINSSKFLTNYTNISYLNGLKEYLSKNDLHLFIYNKEQLFFWSDNEVIIKNPKTIVDEQNRFIKQNNGFYITIHKYLPDLEHQLLILIPIYYQYPIVNEYLKNGFVFKHKILSKVIITTKNVSDEGKIFSIDGSYLFSIKVLDSSSLPGFFFIVILLFLVFYSVYCYTNIILINIKERKYTKVFFLTILFFVLVELVFSKIDVIFNLSNYRFFSSSLYASNYLGKNLFTLFYRTLYILWFFHIIKYFDIYNNKVLNKLFHFLSVCYFYFTIYVVENVVINSTINFNFFSHKSLDAYLYISILLFGTLFFTLFQILNNIFYKGTNKSDFYYILIFVLIFSIFRSIYSKSIYFTAYLAFWFSSFILIFFIKKEIKSKYYFITSVLIIAMLSLLTTTLLWIFTNDKEYEIKKKKIHQLYAERDLLEELDLNEIENKIADDNFIKQYITNPYLSNINLNDRVIKYLQNFNKNYIINSYAYDFSKNTLKGIESKSALYFDKIINYKNTNLVSTYFYHIPIKESGEKYVARFSYDNDSTNVGYLYIELIPRVFKINSAYPELLSKNKTYYDDIFKNYSFAIYQNKHLVKNVGSYEYATYLDFKKPKNLEYLVESKYNFKHLVYFSNDKTIIVSERNRSIWIAFSLFSLVLFTYLIIFILFDYLGLSYNLWIDTKIKDFFNTDSFQKQIQNYIVLLLFLSLTLLAVITFVYFNLQYKNIYYERLQHNINVVVKNFKQLFVEYYPIYGEETYNWVITNKLQQRSDIFETDITAYNTNGDLISTSNPELYKNDLVSKKINSDAYFALHNLRKSKFINNEKIGELDYLSMYITIAIDGNIKLYLQFPHYNIDKYLRSEMILFLLSLVNIYVFFMFLVAFAAVFLSKSITNSLSIIASHIQNVQLNKKNIPLEWNKNDEIGLLVKQYNKMLEELEKSAAALAKSEREGAWSEMAKQVAHEIKNPLTPMKLSIQHLQRAIDNNDGEILELTRKITSRLIEQIDILTDIASAFSDFAKLPSSVVSKIDFIPILLSIIDLFRESDNIKINYLSKINAALVMADKNQLNRVFTNLLKNAIQAIPKSKNGQIDIDILNNENDFIISIKDNGDGIAKDKYERIFEPNFTTKSSGTGLGLAICKNIIDSIGGKIWFESKQNAYTIFYVQISKANESTLPTI